MGFNSVVKRCEICSQIPDFQSFCGVMVVLFLLLQNHFNRNLCELVNEIFNIEEIMG